MDNYYIQLLLFPTIPLSLFVQCIVNHSCPLLPPPTHALQVIRHYHGHLSAVYCISLHPTIDVLITGGRDATARVWDMRTKACVHTLSCHTNTVADIITQAANPQVSRPSL